jgi:hypothetical protein
MGVARLELAEYLRYRELEFAAKTWPHVTHALWQLRRTLDGSDECPRRPLNPKSLTCLVGLFPERSKTQRPKSIQFFAFSRCRSTYAALRDVEDVFAEFYLMTDMLPVITPAPDSLLRHLDRMPDQPRLEMSKRGVLVYDPRG